MSELQERKNDLLELANQYHKYKIESQKCPDVIFLPEVIPFPAYYEGIYDDASNCITVRFPLKGLKYDGRTKIADQVHNGEELELIRDSLNEFNTNNFKVITKNTKLDVGNLPAELCNRLAYLYDLGYAVVKQSKVSYIEYLSKRSIHAAEAVIFAEVIVEIRGI